MMPLMPISHLFSILNKYAFQYDAYHPLVARISQHALRGPALLGESALSGGGGAFTLPEGSALPGGAFSQGGLPCRGGGGAALERGEGYPTMQWDRLPL